MLIFRRRSTNGQVHVGISAVLPYAEVVDRQGVVHESSDPDVAGILDLLRGAGLKPLSVYQVVLFEIDVDVPGST